jgi:putative FmdB family regulatory protein
MPIFEFGCRKCRKKFEKIVPPGRAPASAACPRCGTKSGRLASRFAVAGASRKSESDDFDAGDLDDSGDDFGGGDDSFDDEGGGAGDDDFGGKDDLGDDDLD